MGFTFETVYHQKALTVMARTLRKTVRKKRSRRSHLFGWIVVVIGLIFSFLPGENGFSIDMGTIITWIAVAAILVAFIWEDKLNAYVAMKRMLPGMKKAITVFREDGYTTTTEIGITEWQYSTINLVAETAEYFVFVFGNNHSQLYDKNTLAGGTAAEFQTFIEEKTGKKTVYVQ